MSDERDNSVKTAEEKEGLDIFIIICCLEKTETNKNAFKKAQMFDLNAMLAEAKKVFLFFN